MHPGDEIEFVGHVDTNCPYCHSKGYDFITMPLERQRTMIFKCRKCREAFGEMKVTVNFDASDYPCGATVSIGLPVDVMMNGWQREPISMRHAYRGDHGPRFVMRQRDKINLRLVSW